MVKKTVLAQEDFDALLNWLDVNRENATRKYEQIRQRLIQIFANRGCFEAEELADETINRTASKAPQMIETYVGEPALYFYGVAVHVHQEWLRTQRTIKKLEFTEEDQRGSLDLEAKEQCLEKCLGTLPNVQRHLIIEYYRNDKRAKIEHRKDLAEQIGISLNTLQGKTYRIRTVLQKCVEKCVNSQ